MSDAVILCGGLGTRLRGVLDDRPKCLAPVAGRTYLDFLTDYLHKQGVGHFVFATGYRHDQVEDWLKSSLRSWTWKTSVEPEPLGTGGALRLAAPMIRDEKFLAFNGDTFLEVSCVDLISCHDAKHSPVTLAAVQVPDTAAFGRIKVEDGHVVEFHEKGLAGPGLINGGAYVIDKSFALSWPAGPLSLERDILARPGLAPAAHLTSGRFLDIGTPENLALAGEMAVALN